MNNINGLPPFKRLCVTIGNLPSSYVDSMSYYECLMWLCKYLKETVIPAINENAEAVKEIQDWIENLDLQDEVDTKLDEMAESGQLQEIISEYLNSKAIFGFDTLADMKSATNLINGSYARTLGYHSINNGGAGLYKIRTVTNEDIVDEGSIIALDNQNLIAELIIDNKISPLQFGCYGDGEHDDTTALQNCINYAENKVISNNVIGKDEPVIMLEGTYKITNTIILSPLLTYELVGDPSIISYLLDGTAVHLKYRDIPDQNIINNDSTSWTRGQMFYGGCLHITNNYTKDTSNTIGLEIQNTENPNNSYKALARGSIDNITVTRFKKGIKLNDYHCYIFSFRNLCLYYNEIDFEVGDPGDINTDFGENMSFFNCLFGTSKYNFKTNISSAQYTFYSCSFDFATAGAIYINKGCSINIVNGWIEACRNIDSDLSGMIATPNDNIYATVSLLNTRIVESYENIPIISGKNLTLSISNLIESYNSLTIDDSKLRDIKGFYIAPNSQIENANSRTELKMISPKFNKYIDHSLEDETVNNTIVSGGNTVFAKYVYKTATTEMKIVSDNNEKCISIVDTEGGKFEGTFKLDEDIPVELFNKINVSYMYKLTEGSVSPVIQAIYLDANKNQIGSKTWTGTGSNLLTPSQNWQKPPINPYFEDIPAKTRYVRINYAFNSKVNSNNPILVKNFHVETR